MKICSKDLFSYLKENWKKDKERESPSVVSLPTELQQPGLNQAEVRPLTWVKGPNQLGQPSLLFPNALARSCIGSAAARVQISATNGILLLQVAG